MDPNLDSKQRYVELKKRMKHLLHENESYKQEIAKVNERLLNVSKDKAFLLEQLLQFEDNDSSTESELSDSDQDRKLPEPPKKKPRQRKPKAPAATSQATPNAAWSTPPKSHNRTALNTAAANTNPGNHGGPSHSKATSRSGAGSGQTKRRNKHDNQGRNKHAIGPQAGVHNQAHTTMSKVPTVGNHSGNQSTTPSPSPTLNRNTLTAEEVERHLQAKSGPRLPMPQPTSLTLPAELFNDDAFMTDFGSDRGNV